MTKLLSLLLALMLLLALCACGGQTEPQEAETTETTETTEPAEPAETEEPAEEPAGAETAAGSLEAPDVAGSVETWGNISVLVPEGMVLNGGSLTDKEDPNTLWVQDPDSMTPYFLISLYSEENAASSIETTKELNDGQDITPFALNGVEWTGVDYDSGGLPCFQVMGGGFLVSGAGYGLDDDAALAVLASLENIGG